MKYLLAVIAALSLLMLLASAALAQWSETGLPVVTAPGTQNAAAIAVDDAGNTTIVWQDYRGSDGDLYALRFDAYGTPLWVETAVCTTAGNQTGADIINDGAGGVFVVWHDGRGSDDDIYAQRLDADGNPVWAANGVAVCTAVNNQWTALIVPDGEGGAVISWRDYRTDTEGDIYAQRIDSGGNPLWNTNGNPVCVTAGRQQSVAMDRAADGGAVLAWRDDRLGTDHIYGNRLEGDGDRRWGTTGTQICGAVGGQYEPQILHDGNNGAFVVWQDYRTGIYDIYAQHMNYNGFDEWTTDGLLICGAANSQRFPVLCTDGEGGFITAWHDERNSTSTYNDVYAQRVDHWGNVQWAANGVVVCNEYGHQQAVQICSDGVGGAVLVWDDLRAGRHDVFANRLDDSGSRVWVPDGVRMLIAPQLASGPYDLTENAAGGGVFVHIIQDDAPHYAPVLQRVDRFGYWGHPSATLTGVADIPGDEGGYVSVSWDASRLDPWPHNGIDNYTVWRSISGPAASAMVKRGEAVLTDGVEPVDGKAIRVQELAGQMYYWEQVDQVEASYLTTYSSTAPTLFDTTSTVQVPHYWQLVTHHISPYYWISAPMEGASGDNLAPSMPLNLAAARAAADVALEWNPVDVTDLGHYAIYRSEFGGFTPGPGTFLTTAADTAYLDTSADPARTLYYKVTAVDVHENESVASNEAMADVVSGIGDRAPAINSLTVLANVPNPFRRTTELRIGLPASGEVTVAVYDVAGRRVLHQRATLADGWQRLALDAGSLPSGVYFYRVRAAGETVTKKMVIQR